MEEKTLYEILGESNLKILVDRFYDKVFKNETIKDLFSNTPAETIKHKQFLFLTQFLGGPPIYTQEFGHPRLRARHLPHKITEESAIAWLKCMNDAINSLDVPQNVKDELFSRFPQTAFFMVNSD